MIQTIGLSVGAAVAYIIVVLGLMFYCKKRRNAKRLQKGQDGEEPEMECLNGRKRFLDCTCSTKKVSQGLLQAKWAQSNTDPRPYETVGLKCEPSAFHGIETGEKQ